MKLVPLSLLLTASVASAQIRIAAVHGDVQWESTGWAVCGLDDMDGDGYPEFLSTTPHDDTAPGQEGSASVYSGLDGSLRYKLDGYPSVSTIPFGWSARVLGDLDLDGFDDFAVGYPDDSTLHDRGGSVRVFSGSSGNELLAIFGSHSLQRYGYTVGAAGDVDGDSTPDVIVGTLLESSIQPQGGMAQVVSGSDGSVLHTWFGTQSFGKFGSAVSGAGDVDGDGTNDLIVGAQQEGAGFSRGRAYVFSGADGSELHHWEAADEFSLFGISVAALGDVTGDGLADVAVGAAQGDYVHVYSGADGTLAYEVSIPDRPGAFGFGTALSCRRDLDGDGLCDLLIGSPDEAAVHAYSGVNGALIFVKDGDVPGFLGGDYGWSVDSAPPIAGVDVPTFVVGAPAAGPSGDEGGIALLYALDAFWINYCDTSPNSVGPGALIRLNGSLSVSTNSTRLEAHHCPPNVSAIFFYGPNRVAAPFGNGLRCVGGAINRLAVFSTGPNGTPSFLMDLDDPPNESGRIHPGTRWRFQCWYRDTAGGGAGFNLSDGAEAWFLP